MNVFFKQKKKKIISPLKAVIFLRINANSAISGPPLGAVLGQYGVAVVPFCNQFNERTSDINPDTVLNVTLFLSISGDYRFSISLPTFSFFFKKSLSITKASSFPASKTKDIDSFLITPLIIYEVYVYKKKFSNIFGDNIRNSVKSAKGLLSSMGIFIVE